MNEPASRAGPALVLLTPLLRLSAHAATLQTSVTSQVALLSVPGAILVVAAAFLATRLT